MNARDLLSGACGGGLAVLISQPIDVVRVQLQTMPGSSSAVATARTLVQQRGILSLWRGTTPPLLGAGLLMSVFRTTQQSTSRVFGEDGSFVKFAAAGAIGGLAQAPLAVPVEHLKVRLQVCQAQWCSCGIVPLARHIVSVAGVGALWRGWAPTVMRDVVSTPSPRRRRVTRLSSPAHRPLAGADWIRPVLWLHRLRARSHLPHRPARRRQLCRELRRRLRSGLDLLRLRHPKTRSVFGCKIGSLLKPCQQSR